MKLVLKINNIDKTFESPFISARKLRKTMEIGQKISSGKIGVDAIDDLLSYIVDIFGNQFTLDEAYDGLASNKIMSTTVECINEVTGKLGESLEEINKSEKKRVRGEGEKLSPLDFIKSIYSNLLYEGWSLKDIDEMDIFFYFEILEFRLREKEEAQNGYIEDVL